MQRPDFIAIFSPVKGNTKETAAKLFTFLVEDVNGQLASYYYARIDYDAKGRQYHFCDETLQLESREELFQRIERDGDAMWCMMVGLGFAPAEIYPAVFADVEKPSQTTVVLSIDPQITRWFETEEATRGPFVLFLIRVANAIGSSWFVSGPYIDKWNPLDISKPLDYASLGMPYVVGWKAGAPEEAKILAALDIKDDDVLMTSLKYKFAYFLPSRS
jgi:hypothetical protein